jgi:subtilisin family serine protease
MRKTLTIVLVSLLVLGTLQAASARRAERTGRFVVTFEKRLPTRIASRLVGAGSVGVMGFPAIKAVTFTGPVSLAIDLARDGRVLQVREQRGIEMALYRSVKQMRAQGVEADDDFTLEEEVLVRPGVSGKGQTIAVVDTGIWEGHPDLVGKVKKHLNFEYSYLATEDVFAPEQRDVVFDATGAYASVDQWGHGTHVAGIAAGTGKASVGRENHGVAPDANLVSLKIGDLHNGFEFTGDAGWEANALAALDWIHRHHDDPELGEMGLRIVNNSWVANPNDVLFGPVDYDPLREITELLNEDGVIQIYAAGNAGGAGINPVPNGMEEVITVTNACKVVDSCGEGNIAGDSSKGPAADVAAPGNNIVSACAPGSLICLLQPFFGGTYGDTTEEQTINKTFYTGASGTSMAAPHVAGLVALMLEVAPDLSPEQVHRILVRTARDMGAPGHDDHSGWGLVDARAALRFAHSWGRIGIPPGW